MAIARVQSKTATTAATPATSLNVVLDAAPTAGNIVVLSISSTALVTVPSGGLIEWLGISILSGTVARSGAMYVGKVLAGASATITITAPGGATTISAVAAEYSGASHAVDRAKWATGNSTSLSSGASGTTSTADQLWIGGLTSSVTNGTTFTAIGGSFSLVAQVSSTLNTSSDRTAGIIERIVTATGTATASATAGSANWTAIVMTFPEIPVGGGGLTETSCITLL